MRVFARVAGAFAVLLVVFVAGIRVGANPLSIPHIFQGVAGTTEDTTFNQVAKLIKDNYYRRIPDSQIQNKGAEFAVLSLRDRFSQYFTPQEYAQYKRALNPHFSGIGLNVAFSPKGLRVTSVYSGTPAFKAGIRPGESLVSVNGRSLAGNSVTKSVSLVTGKPGTYVTVGVVSRDGKPRTLKVRRSLITVPPVESKLVTTAGGRRVGVVALSGFVPGAGAQVGTATRSLIKRGATSIVLDLRGNGGGLIDEAVSVASLFIAKGTIVSTAGRNRPKEVYKATGQVIKPSLPVVVLVDRNSASASEIVAGAIQDTHRGVIVGTRTFGKGVFQEMTPLSNKGALDITVGQFFLPSGRNIGGAGIHTGAGIEPDVPVASSAGARAALAAAIAKAASR